MGKKMEIGGGEGETVFLCRVEEEEEEKEDQNEVRKNEINWNKYGLVN